MVTLDEIKDMTDRLYKLTGGAVSIDLEIWQYGHKDEKPSHKWNVWLASEAKHYYFKSWEELILWSRYYQYPQRDRVEIDERDYSDDELHADVSPTIGDMAHALDSGAI